MSAPSPIPSSARHIRAALAACALLTTTHTASAQVSVEFRIVERLGRAQLLSSDPVLDLAVQARILGGPALGDFSFDIRVAGEPESAGTLARARTSNSDGTYTALPPSITSSVGLGGIARTYSYVAGINPNFNGLINASAGPFTHTPGNQEIGQIVGSATGGTLLGTPGIDEWNGDDQTPPPAADGTPDTWNLAHPWSSSAVATGPVPISGDSASIAPSAAGPYFARAQFIDLYRFRYTVTDLSPRTLHFQLNAVTAKVCDDLAFGYSWTTRNTPPPAPPVVQTLDIPIAGACCNTLDGTCAIATSCPTGPLFAGVCAPNPCTSGTCCTPDGSCTIELRAACTASWSAAGSCTPNPCPQLGACCTASGTCSIAYAAACSGYWLASGTCSASDCSGACCVSASCSIADAFTCIVALHGHFQSPGSACGLPANPTTCCPANFNGIDGLNAQDIFDFLSAWFNGDPRTDIDHDGQILYFDIVTFIHAWFAGC